MNEKKEKRKMRNTEGRGEKKKGGNRRDKIHEKNLHQIGLQKNGFYQQITNLYATCTNITH